MRNSGSEVTGTYMSENSGTNDNIPGLVLLLLMFLHR